MVSVYLRLVLTRNREFSKVPKTLKADVKKAATEAIGTVVSGVEVTAELVAELFTD